MREIRLGVGRGGPGSGHAALVDDADFALASQHAWHAFRQGATVYARRKWYEDGRGSRAHSEFMHDLIMGMRGVDHQDHDGLNNQRSNLRVAGQSRNGQNMRKTSSATSSRYKGVSWHRRRGKWQAQIRLDGRLRHLGSFSDETEAARAYDVAAREAFGEFAYPNFEQNGGPES